MGAYRLCSSRPHQLLSTHEWPYSDCPSKLVNLSSITRSCPDASMASSDLNRLMSTAITRRPQLVSYQQLHKEKLKKLAA
jgi:hypothetical protein